jgi:hypothetical protein
LNSFDLPPDLIHSSRLKDPKCAGFLIRNGRGAGTLLHHSDAYGVGYYVVPAAPTPSVRASRPPPELPGKPRASRLAGLLLRVLRITRHSLCIFPEGIASAVKKRVPTQKPMPAKGQGAWCTVRKTAEHPRVPRREATRAFKKIEGTSGPSAPPPRPPQCLPSLSHSLSPALLIASARTSLSGSRHSRSVC